MRGKPTRDIFNVKINGTKQEWNLEIEEYCVVSSPWMGLGAYIHIQELGGGVGTSRSRKTVCLGGESRDKEK